MALSDEELAKAVYENRQKAAEGVIAKDKALQEKLKNLND